MDTPDKPTNRCPRFFDRRLRAALMAAAVVAVATNAVGCRSGASATAAPSWWSFGGKGSDAEKLSAAPPFEGPVKKPSEAAAPYPTTTTPHGYAVADATVGPSQPGAPPSLPPAEPAAVTYGSQPPPSATAATAPRAVTAPPAPPAIATQVGPYAPLAGAAPPASPPLAATPASPPLAQPFAAPPSSGSFPATAGYEPTAAANSPDPHGFAAPSTVSPISPASVEPASPASRYASVPGSRFGGASFSSPPAAAPLEPVTPFATPAPPPPPTATSLPAAPPLPAASPLASPPVLPGAPPLPSPPTSPPPRRPDPGYRPGGTSSYRPTRAILVDSAPAEASAVRTAAFETPAATAQ